MARGILLRRLDSERVAYANVVAFRLRVEVAEVSGGMDRFVFLYAQAPVNPVTGEQLDLFQTVASAPDMADYPAGGPAAGTEFPFFRLDYFEVDLRSSQAVEELWRIVVAEAGGLAKTMDRLEQLTPTAEVWVGEPPAVSESASVSS